MTDKAKQQNQQLQQDIQQFFLENPTRKVVLRGDRLKSGKLVGGGQ